MSAPKLSDAQCMQAAEAYRRLGSEGWKLIAGITSSGYEARVRTAVSRGFLSRDERRSVPPGTPMPSAAAAALPVRYATQPVLPTVAPPALDVPPEAKAIGPDDVKAMIARQPRTIDDLAESLGVAPGRVAQVLDQMRDSGLNVVNTGGRVGLMHAPAAKHGQGAASMPVYTSRADGSYLFGFTSDNHLGSKYARLDVLNDLYDRFAEQGVDRVFNAGNWVDGEARFNVHDLLVHGMDPQLQYLAENYPSRPGVVTYAVAGDDHEGWYCQREGVDIGRYAERVMRDRGRTDWVDLGYMEAYVRLKHAGSGAETMLHVMHPGGGSAYAVSYTVQKIAEAYDGGDKPAVLLAGHYHKLSYNIVRGVHAIQTGTTEDQTPFMRKKKLSAHVGGGICRLTQDPATGAILSCRVEFFTYFVQGYYNNRWSMSGDVNLASRGV